MTTTTQKVREPCGGSWFDVKATRFAADASRRCHRRRSSCVLLCACLCAMRQCVHARAAAMRLCTAAASERARAQMCTQFHVVEHSSVVRSFLFVRESLCFRDLALQSRRRQHTICSMAYRDAQMHIHINNSIPYEPRCEKTRT